MVIVTKGGGVEGGGGLKPLWLGKKLRSKKKRKICCSVAPFFPGANWKPTQAPPSTLHFGTYIQEKTLEHKNKVAYIPLAGRARR